MTLHPWIIWSNEHRAFWRPNRCGYTTAIEAAGRYSKAEAEAICRDACPRANSTINVGTPPEICMPAPEATLVEDVPPQPRRKPQDKASWPPGCDPEAVIDALCGCRGQWDCECVSVFNRARTAAWDAHNRKERT